MVKITMTIIYNNFTKLVLYKKKANEIINTLYQN